MTMGKSDTAQFNQSIAGHGCLETLNISALNHALGERIKENILSGKFYPETEAEKKFLRDHKEAQKSKSK